MVVAKKDQCERDSVCFSYRTSFFSKERIVFVGFELNLSLQSKEQKERGKEKRESLLGMLVMFFDKKNSVSFLFYKKDQGQTSTLTVKIGIKQ